MTVRIRDWRFPNADKAICAARQELDLSHRAHRATEHKKQAATLRDLCDLRWPGLAGLQILAPGHIDPKSHSRQEAVFCDRPQTQVQSDLYCLAPPACGGIWD